MSSDAAADADGADEPATIELAFTLIVFWALASTTTAVSYTYGVGYGYFEVLGYALIVSGSCVAYHHRATIREWWADRRESWSKAGEPIDPDDVIDDVLEDGDGGST